MKVLKSGHSYLLDNLKEDTKTRLDFHMDPRIHNGESQSGPSTQEVLRACIERVQSLDVEKPWEGNARIIHHLRSAIMEFEIRALQRAVDKGEAIELWPVGPDGHIFK